MEETVNQVITLYLEEKCSLSELEKKFKISQDLIIEKLHELGYLYAKRGAQAKTVKKVKAAADKYIELGGFPNTTVTKTAKEMKLSPAILSVYLQQYYPEVRLYGIANFNEKVFDTIDTEEKAYWLGFIFADGHINSSPLEENKNSNYEFELSLGLKDLSHLKKFAKFMEWEEHLIIDDFRCRFCVNSKHLWKVLNNYGCTPRKSLTLRFPIKESFSEESLIKHFIRGYWDGDGCLTYCDKENTSPEISVIGTAEFLTAIQKYLPLKKEYALNIQHIDNQNITKNFKISGNEAIRIASYLYEKSVIYLDRKYEKYINYCRLLEGSNKL